MNSEPSIYDQIGGEPTFTALVEAFYEGVATDDLIRPMYPSELSDAKRHLMLFLCQYFGGPRRYEEERGHPRLRMRHAPFEVSEEARDTWLAHMSTAIDKVAIAEPARSILLNYFASTADFLVNVPRNLTIEVR
jgi:hemoglobin